MINKKVPDFELRELGSSNKIIDNAVFLGRTSLLNIWASWCSSCVVEHKLFMDIASSNIVQLIGVAYKDSDEDSQRWLNKLGNPYTYILTDAEGGFGIDLGVYGVPETYVVDNKGIVRYKHIGAVSENDWKNVLMPLINKLKSEI